jgi:hypothetical protein
MRIKYLPSIALTFTLLSSSSFAQLGIKGGVAYGMFAGGGAPAYTAFLTDGETPLSSRPMSASLGFAGGVSYRFVLSTSVSVQAELIYTRRGSIYILPYGTSEEKYSFEYVDLPLTLQYAFPLTAMQPFLEGGIAYCDPLKANVTDGFINYDMKDVLSKSDLSIILGLGIRLPISVVNVSVEARYFLGLTEIPRNYDSAVYNRTFEILTGVEF